MHRSAGRFAQVGPVVYEPIRWIFLKKWRAQTTVPYKALHALLDAHDRPAGWSMEAMLKWSAVVDRDPSRSRFFYEGQLGQRRSES